MTRGEPIGERVTRVEEELGHLKGAVDENHRNVMDKLDAVLAGQHEAALHRIEMNGNISAMKKDIAAMQPHTATVAHAKIFWVWTAAIATVLSAIIGVVWAAWAMFAKYFTFKWPS